MVISKKIYFFDASPHSHPMAGGLQNRFKIVMLANSLTTASRTLTIWIKSGRNPPPSIGATVSKQLTMSPDYEQQ